MARSPGPYIQGMLAEVAGVPSRIAWRFESTGLSPWRWGRTCIHATMGSCTPAVGSATTFRHKTGQ